MKQTTILFWAVLFTIILSSLSSFSLALYNCGDGSCSSGTDCAPGFDCCPKLTKCQDGNGVYFDFISVCSDDCSGGGGTGYEYGSSSISVNNCKTAETNCSDGVDNDCDGKTDCADSDCASACCTDPDTCESSCSGGWWWLSTPTYDWSSWLYDSADAGGASCCGDDSAEVYIEKKYAFATNWDAIITQAGRDLCCKQATDCTSLVEGTGSKGCYVEGAHLGVSTTNNGWICENNVWYECENPKLCQEKQGEKCVLNSGDYLWSSLPPAETDCRDQYDNNCNGEADYDTLYQTTPTTSHGDIGCPVGVISASASPTSVEQNGVVDVQCTSTVGVTNAIFVYRDDNNNNVYDAGEYDCGWSEPPDGWSGNKATFHDCNVGSAIGSVAFRCSVYNGGNKPYDRAYMSGNEKEVSVTVTASSCSGYSDEATCAGGSCCWVGGTTYPTCNGSKWNGYLNTCIDTASCPPAYSCSVSRCGAQCDGTTSIPNGYCNATTCTPQCNAGYSWNGTDCVSNTYSCTGADPLNAHLCSGDDAGLIADTPKVLVSACSAPAGSAPKCEYTCNDGFVFNTTSGQCDSVSVTFCGDGTVQTPNDNGENEECDDGNTIDGDGCNSTCQYENCLDFFTGPSNGACANIRSDGYDLSWTPPTTPSWGAVKQVLRVDEDESEVRNGCPTPGDCEVKEDSLGWTNSSYQVIGALQPDTLYYNRVAAVCQDLDGTTRWRDTVWNCTTNIFVESANLSGFVWNASHDPIDGVSVTIVSPPPGFMDVTDGNGYYHFIGVPAGSRWVSASKPGYRSRSVLFFVNASRGENSLNFTLTDGDCSACADWENRCSVACSGVKQCGVPEVPSVCEGARPGEVLWDADKNLYVTCCEGLETRPKLGVPTLGGCMDEVRKSSILRRYLGQLVSIDVYTWRLCSTS